MNENPIVFAGRTYAVRSLTGCTVTQEVDGKTYVDDVPAGQQTLIIAQCGRFVLSDPEAVVTQVGGSASLVSTVHLNDNQTGCVVQAMSGDTLQVRGAVWFKNTEQSSISVQPAAWKNIVLTCYIQTAVPVELAGVRWLYGQPTLVAGYTYVIALQQIGADVVLANLAYTIPQ
jgi:hypothetical protein